MTAVAIGWVLVIVTIAHGGEAQWLRLPMPGVHSCERARAELQQSPDVERVFCVLRGAE